MKNYLILLVLILGVFGCSNQDKAPQLSETAKQNILSVNIGANPSFLNPILYTDSTSHAVVRMVFNGLFKQNVDLEMEPDLVKTFSISENGLLYTFQLHENVFWHDGKLFTADDVVYTFETLINPATNTVRRGHFKINDQPIVFKKIDKFTVQAILPQPYAPFLTVLDMGILPKHILETVDINTADFNRSPIGTGPFKFVEWRPDQFIRLERNDNYFKKTAKLNGIVMRIIPDSTTSLVALKNGEIDLSGIPGKDIEKIKEISWLDFYTYSRLNYSYIGLNLKKPPFDNQLVRQAIAYSINKQIIIDSVLRGYGDEAHIPSSPLSWAYPNNSSLFKYSYKPEMSKRLLEEAGYVYSEDLQLFEKNGTPLNFKIFVSQGSKPGEQIAQIVQRFLSNIGVKMDIQILEWSSFLKTIHSPESPKPFDAVMLGWGFDINDPDDAYTSWHSSQYPNGGNFNGFESSRADELLDKGRITLNKELRKEIYKEFYNIVSEESPYIFLFHPRSAVSVHQYVKGLSKPGPAGLLHDIENVYIETSL